MRNAYQNLIATHGQLCNPKLKEEIARDPIRLTHLLAPVVDWLPLDLIGLAALVDLMLGVEGIG